MSAKPKKLAQFFNRGCRILIKCRDTDRHAVAAVRGEFPDSKGGGAGSPTGVSPEDRVVP